MDNIYVTMMCPGPVQSDIGLHLLTGTSGEVSDCEPCHNHLLTLPSLHKHLHIY